MHWMRDWSTPHPMFVRKARGVEVEDVDGNTTSISVSVTPARCSGIRRRPSRVRWPRRAP
jgi:hypothetical protein